jgi:hypothetical protein
MFMFNSIRVNLINYNALNVVLTYIFTFLKQKFSLVI